MPEPVPATSSLSRYEARTAAAVFERLFPADEHGPGAAGIGVLTYVDRALAGAYRDHADSYRLGLAALDRAARQRTGRPFADGDPGTQDGLLADLEAGRLPGFTVLDQQAFFTLLRTHLQEGLFADPVHGGNRDKAGWRFLGHPGFWPSNTAEENLAAEPVTKGGVVQSLEDVADLLQGPTGRGSRWSWPATTPSGVGPAGRRRRRGPGRGWGHGRGGRPRLAGAGLKVVGLEAGPWRTTRDFLPDELRSAYYCRGDMGAKFLSETPRWRRHPGEPTRPATFTLGRMMNGVGGSVIHWGRSAPLPPPPLPLPQLGRRTLRRAGPARGQHPGRLAGRLRGPGAVLHPGRGAGRGGRRRGRQPVRARSTPCPCRRCGRR